MLDFIPLVVGSDIMETNLVEVIKYMGEHKPAFATGFIMSISKSIGLALALCVGSYECYQMILGRKGLDVMKLVRILGISICISLSGSICSMLAAPGKALSDAAAEECKAQEQAVNNKEDEVLAAQKAYIERIEKQRQDMIEQEHQARLAERGEDSLIPDWMDMAMYIEKMKAAADKYLSMAVMYVVEFVNMIIRLIGSIFFQVLFYAMLLSANIFMLILEVFCPLNFALSLAPPFRSAWSQWLSKYVTLTLWPFVANMIMMYIYHLMGYTLEHDLDVYTAVNPSTEHGLAYTFGVQGLGSTIMYVVACLVGFFLLKMVPEVASWLVPGGQSSGMGASVGATQGAIGAVAAPAAAAAGGAIGGAFGGAAGAVTGGVAGYNSGVDRYASNAVSTPKVGSSNIAVESVKGAGAAAGSALKSGASGAWKGMKSGASKGSKIGK